ncbi:hypothetical protein ACFRCW_36640 [Streptomyces sp. NPDC056653]|uniref:hypothetical protein n=1 Tax=Streptomyces sp. NPDC056653 TaxID=3345894 RepID=UPI0036B53EF8
MKGLRDERRARDGDTRESPRREDGRDQRRTDDPQDRRRPEREGEADVDERERLVRRSRVADRPFE